MGFEGASGFHGATSGVGPILGVDNGLMIVAGFIELGGVLVHDTTIDLDTFYFKLSDGGATDYFKVNASNPNGAGILETKPTYGYTPVVDPLNDFIVGINAAGELYNTGVNVPGGSGFVPYVGAIATVDLNTQDLIAGAFQLGDGATSDITLFNAQAGKQLSISSSGVGFNTFTLTLGAAGSLTDFVTSGPAFSMNQNLRFDTGAISSIYVNNGGLGLRLNGTNDTSGTFGMTIADAGNVGINLATPTATSRFSIAGGTAALSQINLNASTAPVTPKNGDIWYTSNTTSGFNFYSNDGTNTGTSLNVSNASQTFTIYTSNAGSVPVQFGSFTNCAIGLIVNNGNPAIKITTDTAVTISPTATTTGATKHFTYTKATNTGQTASTEINGVLWTNGIRQWATGAITTQREHYLTTPSYRFVAASTITNAYTLYVEAPTASTNATITNNWALGTVGAILVTTTIAAGGTYSTTPDPMIVIQRTTDPNLTTTSHGFADYTIFQSNTSSTSNNMITDNGQMIGATNYNHHSSFQSQFNFNGAGTLTNIYGFNDQCVVNTGTVTNRFGVKIFDVGGAGTLTNNYGIYVDTLAKGANNYGLWINTNSSYLGGFVTVGTTSTKQWTIRGDFAALGELPAGCAMGNLTGGGNCTFIPSFSTNAGDKLVIGYSGSIFRSALEIANTASSVGTLTLMKSGGTIAMNGNIVATPVLVTATATTSFLFTNSANTNQTLSTEIPGFKYAGGSRQWATGDFATQRESYFSTTTYTAVGASIITNAYGMYVEAPTASTNITITNNYSAGFSGGNGIIVSPTNSSSNGVAYFNVTTSTSVACLRVFSANSGNGTEVRVGGGTGLNFLTVSGQMATGAIRIDSGIGGVDTDTYLSFLRNGSNRFFIGKTATDTFQIYDSLNSASRFVIGNQAASGAINQFIFSGASTTNQTLSTEMPGYLFNSYSRQWATGAIATQREHYIKTVTYTAVGASTITNAYGMFVEAPTASTNVTITNNYALGLSGDLRIITGTVANQGIVLTNLVGNTPFGAIYMGVTPGGTNYVLVNNGTSTFLNCTGGGTTAIQEGGNTFMQGTRSAISFIPVAAAATATTPFTYTVPANTNQTLSTEIPSEKYNGGSRQWATGAITTQRERFQTTITYTAVGASTITNAYGYYIQAPTASTNVTITNNYALGVEGNFVLTVAGNGIYIKEGANATMGRAVLVGGTVVVNTTKVTANSEIFLTSNVDGGTNGFVRVSARTAATSFTITSSNVLDTSTVAWVILEPTP